MVLEESEASTKAGAKGVAETLSPTAVVPEPDLFLTPTLLWNVVVTGNWTLSVLSRKNLPRASWVDLQSLWSAGSLIVNNRNSIQLRKFPCPRGSSRESLFRPSMGHADRLFNLQNRHRESQTSWRALSRGCTAPIRRVLRITQTRW